MNSLFRTSTLESRAVERLGVIRLPFSWWPAPAAGTFVEYDAPELGEVQIGTIIAGCAAGFQGATGRSSSNAHTALTGRDGQKASARASRRSDRWRTGRSPTTRNVRTSRVRGVWSRS